MIFPSVKFESKVTPKYLTVATSWIYTPSVFRFNDLYGLSLLEWKKTKLVFKILRASLLDFIHSATAWSFWFRISSRSLRFSPNQYILVTSANKWKLSSFEVFGKSLKIYSKNNRGLRMGPWGTPQVIEKESDLWPFIQYIQIVLYWTDMIETSHRLYLSLRNDSVLIKEWIEWLTVSNGFFRSIKMPQTNSQTHCCQLSFGLIE